MDEGLFPSVPPPPEPLAEPNVVDWAVGVAMHRVHNRNLTGNTFNPCRGGQTRFAPIEDAQGNCVPSLYAGSTLEAAIYETVFHDIPVASHDTKTVPREDLEGRKHTTLLPLRPLRLASLRAPDLRKWGIRRESLIGSLPTRYGQTRLWAMAIHHSFHVDGLIWTSNQCDPNDAVLLFGDRVGANDLQVVSVRDGTDGSFVDDVRRAGRRAGIVIAL